MKYLTYIFFTSIFLFYNNVYAVVPKVDIRLTFVSNTYDTPSPGIATLVIDVEAFHTTVNTDINSFQDAIQADANLTPRIISVGFSNELFISSNYTASENFNSPDIQFTYTYNSGAKSQILTSGWRRVVTITIQNNMINELGSIIWSTNIPNFYVSDGSDAPITGSEISIPSLLTDFPLPVELSSFTASTNQSEVSLKWQTKTEVNNYGFEVERASSRTLPNQGWEKIGFIAGNGNSNSPKDYSLTDKNPSGGSKFIYRLKQIDNNGKFTYSDEVEIELVPNEYNLFQNYPNPFNPETNIKFALPKDTELRIVLYNMLGESVMTITEGKYGAGFYQVVLMMSDLPSGVYIYRIESKEFISAKKIILLK